MKERTVFGRVQKFKPEFLLCNRHIHRIYMGERNEIFGWRPPLLVVYKLHTRGDQGQPQGVRCASSDARTGSVEGFGGLCH
jgi:hypothetical protein